MKYGSLFSGIGGLDLGLEWAGMQCVWQCEINPFCRKVLAKHWPGVPCYEDVKAIDENSPAIDLLCGGFPCQPHSVAGKRKGKDDERNLWPECIRLVRLLRPSWCLFENVPGLLSTMFGQVCDELRGADYEVWTLVLGADDVRAPHRRKRVWIICHAKHDGLSASQECRGPKSRTDRSKAGTVQGRQFKRSIDASLANAGRISDAGRGDTEDLGGTSGPTFEEKEERQRLRDSIDNGSSTVAITRHERLEGAGQCNAGAFSTTKTPQRVADSIRHDGRGLNGQEGSGRQIRQASQELVHAESTESERAEAGKAWVFRWPSRPGEPQRPWEHPRLISNPNARQGHGKRNQRNEGNQRSDGNAGAAESSMGESANGLSRRLARLRREQLKALGNAVVPQVAELLGKAIIHAHSLTQGA